MGQEGGVRKSLVSLLNGMGHRRGPGKEFGRTNEGISEGAEDGGGVRDKTAIEFDEAKEVLKIFDGGGLGIVGNGLNMGGKGSDAGSGDMMTKKVNSRLGKRAFLVVDKNAIGSEDGKDLVEVVEVLLKGRTGNENVIKVDKGERKILENVVHQTLKGLSSITEAIGHVKILKEAEGSNHSSFGNIRGMNRNLMIGLHQI